MWIYTDKKSNQFDEGFHYLFFSFLFSNLTFYQSPKKEDDEEAENEEHEDVGGRAASKAAATKAKASTDPRFDVPSRVRRMALEVT